jgi:outer membrane lipoprotein SlyB
MTRSLLAWALAAVLAAGCANAPPGDEDTGLPSVPPAPAEPKEYSGVVTEVREVELDSAASGVGRMAGAVIGGSAGASVGSGRGAAVGAVIGTVAGAVAGEAAASSVTRPGLEITVRLDGGRIVSVTQAADEAFKPGERVRVRSDGRTARVIKAGDGGL